MDNYFDHVAAGYDKDFTHTETGKKQRQIVYDFLQERLPGWKDIFEVNCGTGEDAIWLSRKGARVIATDISAEMIRTAREKSTGLDISNIDFRQLDIKMLAQYNPDRKYDLVFSNFGGLNCLDPGELRTFLNTVAQRLLKRTGSIVMVIMSRGSIWESIFYLRKLNVRKAFRRYTSKALPVNLNGVSVPTYYYNPSFFRSLQDEFSIVTIRTVGFFLPPSYLEPIFSKRPRLLQRLFSWERKVKSIAALAGFSDHYLIELRPK